MEPRNNYPFILHWVWGYETKIPPINISTRKEKIIFYASGSVGVCYEWTNKNQYLLLGHKNNITAIGATSDRKYLATADHGEENTLIIWQADSRYVYHVISGYFPPQGVISMCFSSDGSKLMVLSGSKPQELSVWDWYNKKTHPDFAYKYKENVEFQHYVTYHLENSSHFASCGLESVCFFEKMENDVKTALLDIKKLYDDKISKKIGNFTQTTFSLVSALAVTATTKGMIILWGRPLYNKKNPAQDSSEWLFMNPDERVCIRMIQATESKCPISFLTAFDSWILTGTGKSDILYYDENFSVQWSKSFGAGHINGISVNYKPKFGLKGAVRKLFGKEKELTASPFVENDFIISTVEGYVGYYTKVSERLEQILWGTNNIKSVSLHPVWPFIYFGDYSGSLQKWNYISKELLNTEVYKGSCFEVELIAVDNKGAYAACVLSNGNLLVFDAICFTSIPCFTAEEVRHKPIRIEFSPDSQHLLITDVSSYVTHYRLQLLVVPEVNQLLKNGKIPEEPIWSYGGNIRQHQSRIVDCMFNTPEKNEAIYFYSLGEDRYLVQYNISNSKGLNVDVSKRIVLERKPVPTCMTWYPLYDVTNLIAILSDDNKMRIYSTNTEKVVRIISLPLYEEPIKRIILKSQFKHMLTKEFPHCTDIKDVFLYFIFNCSHMIGMSKYPIDGNPNTSMGVTSTPSGINNIVSNKDHTFLFTTGMQDCWIFMYEINIMALLKAEKEGGEGIDAFKYLFPSNSDPDEMKKRLIYSVYSLELEMKMCKIETENSTLIGEIPFSFLPYVLSALGCFVSSADLQLMLKDIEFENKYLYHGKKTTLSCLDVMKLYVNYRPTDPVSKSKLKETFHDILALEEDPDQMPRARFIDILTSRGDCLSHNELLRILKCLQNVEHVNGHGNNSSSEDDDDDNSKQKVDGNEVDQLSIIDSDAEILKTLMPEVRF